MAAIYNDNSVSYGSRVLSVNSVNYIADNFTVSTPVVEVLRTNESGEPIGSVGIPDFVRGSAQVQMATNAVYLTYGQNFTCNYANVVNAVFFIQNADYPEDKAGEKKQNITFIKKYGA
jgi:hypothetical protein